MDPSTTAKSFLSGIVKTIGDIVNIIVNQPPLFENDPIFI